MHDYSCISKYMYLLIFTWLTVHPLVGRAHNTLTISAAKGIEKTRKHPRMFIDTSPNLDLVQKLQTWYQENEITSVCFHYFQVQFDGEQ